MGVTLGPAPAITPGNQPGGSIMLKIVALSALLPLAACGASPANDTAPAPVATPSAAPAEAPSPTPAASPVAERPALTIEGEGLRLFDPASGRATPIAFGTPEANTVSAVSAALGKPDTRGTNPDCPTGPVTTASWNKGLTLHFRDGAFIGWAGAVDLTTVTGIGFGSTRKQLDDAYDATVEQTGLGTQFSAGGLSGTLESDAPDAAITEIWAGEACVAS